MAPRNMLLALFFIQLFVYIETGGILKLTFTDFLHSFPCHIPGECSFMFDVCLRPLNRSLVLGDNSCQYFSKNSSELEPITLHFTQWPGSVLLSIGVVYSDNKTDTYDYLQVSLNNTRERKIQLEMKNKTRLTVISILHCDMQYYGNYCSVFCHPRSDDQGHFNCDPETGEFICLKGWTGPNCREKLVKSITSKPSFNTSPNNETRLKINHIKSKLVVNQTTSPNVLINEIEHSVSSLIRTTSSVWTTTVSTDVIASQITSDDNKFKTSPQADDVTSLGTSQITTLTSSVTYDQPVTPEIEDEELNSSEVLNYTQNDLTFSFTMNDTSDAKDLEETFQSILNQYIGDMAKYVKTNMSIENKSLHFVLDVNNQSALPRIILVVNEQRLNIESTFLNEASIFDKNNKLERPNSKSVPEWAIILVVVAVILTVVVTMRQSHKYCVSRNSMKPKELDEEGETDLENASSALNFSNPIYNKP